jgi:hypothetical protein
MQLYPSFQAGCPFPQVGIGVIISLYQLRFPMDFGIVTRYTSCILAITDW